MFSKELEELVEAALADGTITEVERKVLHKRAAAEGIDLDEFDVVVDGRLAKMKKQKDWLRPTPPAVPQNEKHGNVVKCPSCGAQVDRTQAICPECGYAFTNVKVASSIQQLYEKLEKADGDVKADDDVSKRISKRVQERAAIISNAPIPTAKDDILEFLSAAVPNATLVNPLTGTTSGRARIVAKIFVRIIIIVILIITLVFICSGGDYEEAVSVGGILGGFALFGGMMGIFYISDGGNASDNEHNQLVPAWKAKCEQIVIKARYGLRNDKETLEEIERYAERIGIKTK